MITKIFVTIIMLMILFNLGRGFFSLLQDDANSTRTIKALTWRVGLSLALFIILFFAFVFGVITPHQVI